MSKVNETLNQRGSKYGSFTENSKLTQKLMEIVLASPNGSQLPSEHKEAFHMIFHKIARICCGDMMYEDNPHDIAGYATLLEQYIKDFKNDANQ